MARYVDIEKAQDVFGELIIPEQQTSMEALPCLLTVSAIPAALGSVCCSLCFEELLDSDAVCPDCGGVIIC